MRESGAAFNAVTYRVLDAYLHPGQKTDWVAVYDKLVKKGEAHADDSWAKHRGRAREASEARPAAGQLRRHLPGPVVRRRDRHQRGRQAAHALRQDQRSWSARMTPWQHSTFVVKWDDRTLNADAFATYTLDADGKITELRMQPISPLTDFSFDFQDLRLKPQAQGRRVADD